MRLLPILAFILIGCSSDPKPSLPLKVAASAVAPIISNNPVTIPHTKDPHKDMVHVVGVHCTKAQQKCIRYKEDPSTTKFARCLEFAEPVCVGSKVPMDYWIDKYEYNELHTRLPMSNVTWTEAKIFCEKDNKRLPSEEEWEFACAGEQNNPYSTGLTRPTKDVCNVDVEKEVVCGRTLCDHRKEIDANPECISGFGVVNMSGSVDEWTTSKPYQHSKNPGLWMPSALRGGHYLPVRNLCHKATHDHEEKFFHQITIGFRCASN